MSHGRTLSGVLALNALGFAVAGPLAGIAGRPAFTVHILQVTLVTLVAAPLLLLAWRPGPIPPWLRALVAPPVAGAVFTVYFMVWHVPAVHAWMTGSLVVHAVALAGFLVTGLLAWWCVCAPTPAAGRAREPAAMLYLFVLGVPLQAIAAIWTMAKDVIYAGYGAGVRGFGLLPLADQQSGGLILWVPAGLVLWIAITVLWVRWSRGIERRERVGGDDEAPPLTIPRS